MMMPERYFLPRRTPAMNRDSKGKRKNARRILLLLNAAEHMGATFDVDNFGNCSACGGVHFGTGRTCVNKQTFPVAPPEATAYQLLYENKARQLAGLIQRGNAAALAKVAKLLSDEDAQRSGNER
jgi:hypothetical protein